MKTLAAAMGIVVIVLLIVGLVMYLRKKFREIAANRENAEQAP